MSCESTQPACGRTPRQSHRAARRLGFSLIEVMVVVVIIGLLAGMVAIRVLDYMDTARTNRAKSDIATIVNAVEAFNLMHGRFPTNDEGLDKLPLKNRNDPWGRPYEYNSPGRDYAFEVVSFGADGREGGSNGDADIGSWDLGTVREAH